MHKLLVIDEAENSRVPFLRGILTRSLQKAGLTFDESYELASKIREELTGLGEISSDALRARVTKHLERFGARAVQRYQQGAPATPTVLVRDEDGHADPYSRGRSRLNLESCGFTIDEAAAIAAKIHDELTAREGDVVKVRELRRMTWRHLCAELGPDAGHRYLVWQQFRHSDRPLLLLIGGTAGVGKSTLATRLAGLLDIVRIQSTDMLREVMRMLIPQRLLPILHTSSFKAWRELPARMRGAEETRALLEDGYLTQAELISVASEAVINRALHERVSLIVEGAHVHPGLLKRIPDETDAVVVPIVLAVLKRSELRSRIRGRGARAPDRRAKRYLDHFEDLWKLQSFLLSEADRFGVPIVTNDEPDDTARTVLATIHEVLSASFDGKPEDVLG